MRRLYIQVSRSRSGDPVLFPLPAPLCRVEEPDDSLDLLSLSVERLCDATHSLNYFTTGVNPGYGIPEFNSVEQVDVLESGYYDSDTKSVVPVGTWVKGNDDLEHWNFQTKDMKTCEAIAKSDMSDLMKLFNQTKGIHTWQYILGCELHDDGTRIGYMQYNYDGEDFLSLDMDTLTWTAANDKAVIIKQQWESTPRATSLKTFLDSDCFQRLQKHLDYGRATLERRVPPEVSLFQKDSSSRVVCHATGFYPKAVSITWQKNGEEVHEDVELRETLPNLDETFQRSSILTVSPDELNQHNYTCIIQHVSLEREMGLRVVNHRVSVGVLIGIIVGAAVFVLLVVIVIVVWKKKPALQRTKTAAQEYRRCMDMSCF
ncbi:hypothetical protein NFI96_032459 [Prochilodus magdalenae]|nr:hypothetical protein NFI96_032459 [Prochilodus magdalenae]